MAQGRFSFTISDLALFLGKSPVTIRGWERQGLMKIPREGRDRRLTSDQVETVALVAFNLKRISLHRLRLIGALVTLINLIEGEDN